MTLDEWINDELERLGCLRAIRLDEQRRHPEMYPGKMPRANGMSSIAALDSARISLAAKQNANALG
jgi:hypothetical protein